MTADKEHLCKLDSSTSSDEDLIALEEAKESILNLSRRKSKMGRNSDKTTGKTKRKQNRKECSDENTDGVKENKQTRQPKAQSSRIAKKHKQIDILSESKKPMKMQSSGFITTRRLTAGVTGIFGNSKASDMVKRRGGKKTIDLNNRKLSTEVKQQVNRNLDRILKHPSFEIQRTASSSNETSRDADTSPAFCKNYGSYQQTRGLQKGQMSASSSYSLKTPSDIQTPHSEFLHQVPIVEISRRLKESLVIVNSFPGKSYLEELREDLRKTYRQEISILKEDEILPNNEQTPPKQHITATQRIPPISVSRQRITTSRNRDVMTFQSKEIIADHKIIDSTEQKDLMLEKPIKSVSRKLPHNKNCTVTTDNCMPGGNYEAQEGREQETTKLDVMHHKSPSFEMIVDKMQTACEVPQLDFQVNEPLAEKEPWHFSHDNQETVFHRQHEGALISNCHQEYHQQHQQQFPQQHYQQQQPQQDSGTYSSESSARDYLIANHPIVTDCRPLYSDRSLVNHPAPTDDARFNYQSTRNHCYRSAFQPRRQGTRENVIRKRLSFAGYGGIDHNYASETGSYDILDYAGVLGDDFNVDFECTTNRTQSPVAFSYMPLRKKPCLDTPSPPMQLYRMKMY